MYRKGVYGRGVYISIKEECIQVRKRGVYKYKRGVYTSMEEECKQVWKKNV